MHVILPCVKESGESKAFLVEVKVDPSLKTCTEKGSRGYSWKNGLLIQSTVDETLGNCEVIVVPKCKRTTIFNVAHDRLGHLGYQKVMLSVVTLSGQDQLQM